MQRSFEELQHALEVPYNSRAVATRVAAGIFSKYYYCMERLEASKRDQERNWALFSKLVPLWLKTPPEKRGVFTIKYDVGKHLESPLSIIVEKDERPVASVGGFVHLEGKQRVLRINNIQGVRGPKHMRFDENDTEFRKRKGEHTRQYELLNKELGKNWMAYFVSHALERAGKFGWQLAGEMPLRYKSEATGEFLTTDEQYDRIVRQYKKAYAAAGLVEQADGTYRKD